MNASQHQPAVRTATFGIALLGLAAFAPAADAKAYWHFSGAFHPAAAHFPIALLAVAGLLEVVRLGRRKKTSGEAGYVCLLLGAAGAVVAAVLGWANADHGEYNGSLAGVLTVHRWLGVAVAAIAVVLAVLATLARAGGNASAKMRWSVSLGMILCAGLVGVTGSYGGKLTFGIDYYETVYNETIGAEAKPQVAKPVAATAPAAPVAPAVPVAAPTKADGPTQPAGSEPADAALPVAAATAAAAALPDVSYHSQIKPIFEAYCTKCHGDTKQKAEYRLDTKDDAFRPGESGEMPIVAGKADESLLVKVIEGKGKYADSLMPPKGNVLSADQVALVRTWIDQGAKWDE